MHKGTTVSSRPSLKTRPVVVSSSKDYTSYKPLSSGNFDATYSDSRETTPAIITSENIAKEPHQGEREQDVTSVSRVFEQTFCSGSQDCTCFMCCCSIVKNMNAEDPYVRWIESNDGEPNTKAVKQYRFSSKKFKPKDVGKFIGKRKKIEEYSPKKSIKISYNIVPDNIQSSANPQIRPHASISVVVPRTATSSSSTYHPIPYTSSMADNSCSDLFNTFLSLVQCDDPLVQSGLTIKGSASSELKPTRVSDSHGKSSCAGPSSHSSKVNGEPLQHETSDDPLQRINPGIVPVFHSAAVQSCQAKDLYTDPVTNYEAETPNTKLSIHPGPRQNNDSSNRRECPNMIPSTHCPNRGIHTGPGTSIQPRISRINCSASQPTTAPCPAQSSHHRLSETLCNDLCTHSIKPPDYPVAAPYPGVATCSAPTTSHTVSDTHCQITPTNKGQYISLPRKSASFSPLAYHQEEFPFHVSSAYPPSSNLSSNHVKHHSTDLDSGTLGNLPLAASIGSLTVSASDPSNAPLNDQTATAASFSGRGSNSNATIILSNASIESVPLISKEDTIVDRNSSPDIICVEEKSSPVTRPCHLLPKNHHSNNVASGRNSKTTTASPNLHSLNISSSANRPNDSTQVHDMKTNQDGCKETCQGEVGVAYDHEGLPKITCFKSLAQTDMQAVEDNETMMSQESSTKSIRKEIPDLHDKQKEVSLSQVSDNSVLSVSTRQSQTYSPSSTKDQIQELFMNQPLPNHAEEQSVDGTNITTYSPTFTSSQTSSCFCQKLHLSSKEKHFILDSENEEPSRCAKKETTETFLNVFKDTEPYQFSSKPETSIKKRDSFSSSSAQRQKSPRNSPNSDFIIPRRKRKGNIVQRHEVKRKKKTYTDLPEFSLSQCGAGYDQSQREKEDEKFSFEKIIVVNNGSGGFAVKKADHKTTLSSSSSEFTVCSEDSFTADQNSSLSNSSSIAQESSEEGEYESYMRSFEDDQCVSSVFVTPENSKNTCPRGHDPPGYELKTELPVGTCIPVSDVNNQRRKLLLQEEASLIERLREVRRLLRQEDLKNVSLSGEGLKIRDQDWRKNTTVYGKKDFRLSYDKAEREKASSQELDDSDDVFSTDNETDQITCKMTQEKNVLCHQVDHFTMPENDQLCQRSMEPMQNQNQIKTNDEDVFPDDVVEIKDHSSEDELCQETTVSPLQKSDRIAGKTHNVLCQVGRHAKEGQFLPESDNCGSDLTTLCSLLSIEHKKVKRTLGNRSKGKLSSGLENYGNSLTASKSSLPVMNKNVGRKIAPSRSTSEKDKSPSPSDNGNVNSTEFYQELCYPDQMSIDDVGDVPSPDMKVLWDTNTMEDFSGNSSSHYTLKALEKYPSKPSLHSPKTFLYPQTPKKKMRRYVTISLFCSGSFSVYGCYDKNTQTSSSSFLSSHLRSCLSKRKKIVQCKGAGMCSICQTKCENVVFIPQPAQMRRNLNEKSEHKRT